MELSEDFKAFLEELKDDDYIGLGNPNAKVLFVGKEATGVTEGTKKSILQKDYSKSFVPEDGSFLRNANCTWQKYQKLYERLYEELFFETIIKKDKYEITFVEDVFTTELSDLPAKTTNKAKKHPEFEERLKKRKRDFWEHKDGFKHGHGFIQKQFPIILIFAMDNIYLEKYDGEVYDLFGVPFRKKVEKQGYNLFLHYTEKGTENQPRLLIHTRQLTNGAPLDLIDEIAKEVGKFAKENNIEVIKAKI